MDQAEQNSTIINIQSQDKIVESFNEYKEK